MFHFTLIRPQGHSAAIFFCFTTLKSLCCPMALRLLSHEQLGNSTSVFPAFIQCYFVFGFGHQRRCVCLWIHCGKFTSFYTRYIRLHLKMVKKKGLVCNVKCLLTNNFLSFYIMHILIYGSKQD